MGTEVREWGEILCRVGYIQEENFVAVCVWVLTGYTYFFMHRKA